MDLVWLVFAGFILLAFTLEAITGFGSIVIALSLGILFLPLDTVLPILVCLSIPMSSMLAFKNRQHIDVPLLFKVIFPSMLLGTLSGYFIKPLIDESLLKQIFGVVLLWFATRELWRLYHKTVKPKRARWLTRLLIYSAGISHGLFASGGPLLVYGLAGEKISKAAFRATLSVVWVSMNVFLLTAFILDGRLQPVLNYVAMYLPLLFVAVKLGNYLHHKLSEQHFRVGIYSLLLMTGIILIVGRYIQ